MNALSTTGVKLPNALNIMCHIDARYGGMSSSVPAFVNATAASERYAAELIAVCSTDESIAPEVPPDVKLRRLSYHRIRGVADVLLRRELRGAVESADVLHVHGIWQQHCLVTTKLAEKKKTPVVVSAHGMLEPWALRNNWMRKAIYSALFERASLRRSACMRALTMCEVNDFRRYGLRNPVAVIPNGVLAPSNITGDIFLSSQPQLRNRQVILFLSRIHYKKGIEPLCRAWARINRRYPDSCLVLAGPDFEGTRQKLESLVTELGIEHAVCFTGMLAGDLRWSALAAARVFILPSFSEGFSMAALEALAVGCPIIVTKGCNFPEVATVGCGWLIEPSVNEIQDALVQFLQSPSAILEDMGNRGRSLVKSKYSWSAIGNQMADVYDWITGGRVPTSVELFQ